MIYNKTRRRGADGATDVRAAARDGVGARRPARTAHRVGRRVDAAHERLDEHSRRSSNRSTGGRAHGAPVAASPRHRIAVSAVGLHAVRGRAAAASACSTAASTGASRITSAAPPSAATRVKLPMATLDEAVLRRLREALRPKRSWRSSTACSQELAPATRARDLARAPARTPDARHGDRPPDEAIAQGGQLPPLLGRTPDAAGAPRGPGRDDHRAQTRSSLADHPGGD